MNVYLETHGCTFNQADSELMCGFLEKENYDIVYSIEEADVVILNTCYVKLPTEQKMITKINQIKEDYPDKKLIIAGCMIEVDPVRLNRFAGDCCWIGPHKLNKTPEIVKKALNGEIVHETGKTTELKVGQPRKRINPIINILQICEGCEGGCTFCCTKRARGHLFSYPTDIIVADAENAIKEGCKELQVTAQDTACFGMDSDESFSALLDKLGKLDGDFKIRVGMMHPKSLKVQLDDVIKSFKENDKLFKFIHLPIQTGSEKVLKEMNRLHTVDEYKYMVERFRSEIPDLSLATDIIVGYPTETDDDFKETLNLIREIKPDIIHISKYMHRPGAKSNNLEEIDYDTMKKRSNQLNQLKTEVMLENNKKYEGTIQRVLITSKGSSGGYVGYTDSYKNVIVDDAEIGSFVDVKIIEGKRTYLVAERI